MSHKKPPICKLSSHEAFVEQAKDAIDRVHYDTSVSPSTKIAFIKELRNYCDIVLEALDETSHEEGQ